MYVFVHRPSVLLTFVMTLSLLALWSLAQPPVYAADAAGRAPSAVPNPVSSYAPPPFYASAVALMDAASGRWLLLDNADAPRAMASTTKIMTAYVALTVAHARLDQPVTVDQDEQDIGVATGSAMGLWAGEQVPLRNLLYGLMLPSGNDAAVAIARGVAGSVPAFAALMNETARRLGMTHTHFVNPHGLDDPDQYASARDLVVLARAAMGVPLFRAIVDTQHITIPATATHHAYTLTNVDWFIQWYPGADGVKPGYTNAAGLCQVVSVHRDGRWLIGAVLNTTDLHTDVRDMMNYGLEDFHWTASGQPGDVESAAVQEGAGATQALYFPKTGHRVKAGFLTYFNAHGGVVVFGYPRTDEFEEDGVTVQYFDSFALWWNAASQTVGVAPLGQEFIPRATLMKATSPMPLAAGALYVAATGHNIYGGFLQLYRQYGPALLGYPMTEAVRVGSGPAAETVQYFTNAVLTWRPGQPARFDAAGDLDLKRRGFL